MARPNADKNTDLEKVSNLVDDGHAQESESANFSQAQMLPRTLLDEYLTSEGFKAKLGVDNLALVNLALLKEAVENSIDSCAESSETPQIDVKYNRVDEKYLDLSIWDNGQGITTEKLSKIIDTSKFHSSKFHYKRPSMGKMGNGTKCFLTAPVVLAIELVLPHPRLNLTYESMGVAHEITFRKGDEKPSVVESTSEIISGTKVTLRLPLYNERWLEEQPYADLLENIAQLKPGIRFSLTTSQQHKLSFGYPIIHGKKPVRAGAFRESIRCFSRSEFHERLDAENVINDRGYTVSAFVSQFRDLSKKEFPINLRDKRLHELQQDAVLVDQLYDWMWAQSDSPLGDVLDGYSLGKRHFVSLGAIKYDAYRGRNTDTLPASIYTPYIVEMALFRKGSGGREVVTAINHSIRMRNPFSGLIFEDPAKVKRGKTVHGAPALKGRYTLEEILEQNGISSNTNIQILINVTTCNINYKDVSKTIIDTSQFFEVCAFLHDFTRGFRRIITRIRPQGFPTSTKKAIIQLLPEAIRIVSDNGVFPFKQRQLFYVLRQLLDETYPGQYNLSYDYLTGDILPNVRNNPEWGIELRGMLKEANGELIMPDGTIISLTTEQEEKFNVEPLMCRFVLFCEKRGVKDLLVEFKLHKRYDCIIYGSQGQPSEATRRSMKKFEDIGVPCFGLHDADVWGVYIARTLRNPTDMMPNHHCNVIDLGLTMSEAVDMGKKPEKIVYGTEEARKKSRIPFDLIQSLPSRELAYYTGLNEDEVKISTIIGSPLYSDYRIELNALTPKELYDMLIRKLSTFGVLTKVRPPPEIIKSKTQINVDYSLEENVQKIILEQVGYSTIVSKLRSTLVELENLNLGNQLNDELDKLPLMMWDEILQADVEAIVTNLLSDKKIRSNIAKQVKKALLTIT